MVLCVFTVDVECISVSVNSIYWFPCSNVTFFFFTLLFSFYSTVVPLNAFHFSLACPVTVLEKLNINFSSPSIIYIIYALLFTIYFNIPDELINFYFFFFYLQLSIVKLKYGIIFMFINMIIITSWKTFVFFSLFEEKKINK